MIFNGTLGAEFSRQGIDDVSKLAWTGNYKQYQTDSSCNFLVEFMIIHAYPVSQESQNVGSGPDCFGLAGVHTQGLWVAEPEKDPCFCRIWPKRFHAYLIFSTTGPYNCQYSKNLKRMNINVNRRFKSQSCQGLAVNFVNRLETESQSPFLTSRETSQICCAFQYFGWFASRLASRL